MRSFHQLTAPALLALVTFCVLDAPAADVRFFGLTKGNYYTQTGVGAPIAVPGLSYEVHAFAELEVPNSLSLATLKWPGIGPIKSLTNHVDSWHFRELFTSHPNLNFGAPNGTYTFTFVTTIDGTKISTLTLSADFYPVPVHVSNFAAAQEIDWRKDFALAWPANSADFFHLRVTEGNELVYETGSQPGAPNALPARATSAIIPANTLAEGRRYNARIVAWVRSTADTASYPGALGWAAYTRATDFQIQTAFAANDVRWLGLYKQQNFIQTSPTAPVPRAEAQFQIASVAEAATPLGLVTASLKFPNNALKNLLAAGPVWTWTENFPTEQAMNAAFPNGNCDVSLQTLNNGLRQLSLNLNGAWPNQPHIINWYEASLVQPGQPFTLRWHPMGGATTNDFIQVRVSRNGQPLFQTGEHPRAQGALNGTASSIVLPGELFEPGEVYEASILFLKATHIDTFAYPRTLALAGYARQTTAALRTRGGEHPAPRIAALSREGGRMRVTIDSAAPGWLYGIEKSSNLSSWANILLTNAPATAFDLYLNQEPGPVFLRALVH